MIRNLVYLCYCRGHYTLPHVLLLRNIYPRNPALEPSHCHIWGFHRSINNRLWGLFHLRTTSPGNPKVVVIAVKGPFQKYLATFSNLHQFYLYSVIHLISTLILGFFQAAFGTKNSVSEPHKTS